MNRAWCLRRCKRRVGKGEQLRVSSGPLMAARLRRVDLPLAVVRSSRTFRRSKRAFCECLLNSSWRSGLRVAVAVEAAVLGAELAGLFEPIPELPPRTMQAHLQIAARDANFLCDCFRRLAVEVGELEHFGVFRTHRGHEAADV